MCGQLLWELRETKSYFLLASAYQTLTNISQWENLLDKHHFLKVSTYL